MNNTHHTHMYVLVPYYSAVESFLSTLRPFAGGGTKTHPRNKFSELSSLPSPIKGFSVLYYVEAINMHDMMCP